MTFLSSFFSPQSSFSWQRDIAILTLVLGILFSFFLGHRHLATPDEARYVEIPREMATTGDYVTPRLNGLKYFEKPPFFYWMQAVSIRLFGIQEGALRLWPAVLSLLGCLMVYGFGRVYLDRLTGVLAALILGTNFLYFILARMIILDTPLTFFMTTSLLGFFAATQTNIRWKKIFFLCAYGGGLACAMLTKGVVSILLGGGIILLWILTVRSYALLKLAFHPLALIVFTLIALPWHLSVASRNPEFLYFYFVHEHLLRYLTPETHRRYQPIWFFLPVIAVGFLPWSAFLMGIIREALSSKKRFFLRLMPPPIESFLILWTLVPFFFFSISKSKLIPYILPIFPALALLVGNACARFFQENKPFPRSVLIIYACLAILAALFCGGYGLYFFALMPSPVQWIPLLVLNTVALCFMSTVLYLLRQPRPVQRQFFCLWGGIVTVLLLSAYVDPLLHPRPTMCDFTPVIQKHLIRNPQTTVASYYKYYQDLPVYLNQYVQVIGFQGELGFGASVEPGQQRLTPPERFWPRWKRGDPYIVVLDRKDYESSFSPQDSPHHALVLMENKNTLLIASPSAISPPRG